MRPLSLLVMAIAIALAGPVQAAGGNAAAGPYRVAESYDTWHDARRGRTLPVKIYAPEGAVGPVPVVLVSHGLGGSREGLAYLGRHLAAHGYLAVHLQHPGSDEAVWRGSADPRAALARAANREAARARYADVPFAIDRLAGLAAPGGPLAGRIDLARLAIAGHSFGARSALVAAGQAHLGGGSFGDPRVRAAVALSPSAPRMGARMAFARMTAPILHITGTEDLNPLDPSMQAAERRIPFETIRGVDQYLIVLDGARHMDFSGSRRSDDPARERHVQEVVKAATVAFLDAVLRGNTDARHWLDAGLPGALAPGDAIEARAAGRGTAPP